MTNSLRSLQTLKAQYSSSGQVWLKERSRRHGYYDSVSSAFLYLAQLHCVDCLWALIDKLTVILRKAKVRLSLALLK